MEIINYSSSFIPNRQADTHVLYMNIKQYNPVFSIEYEYNKQFNYNNKKRLLHSQYDIHTIINILNEFQYTINLIGNNIYITTNNPEELADRLGLNSYILHEDGIELLYDSDISGNNIDIDMLYDVILYESNMSKGYISKNIDGLYEYYHMPEPIYIEEQYNQYHLDYLSRDGITMYDISEEQRYLYTISRELPINLRYILNDRDNIDSILFVDSTISIFFSNKEHIEIKDTTIDVFKSLVSNLYHGNTFYDYIRLVKPNMITKTYTLHTLDDIDN